MTSESQGPENQASVLFKKKMQAFEETKQGAGQYMKLDKSKIWRIYNKHCDGSEGPFCTYFAYYHYH